MCSRRAQTRLRAPVKRQGNLPPTKDALSSPAPPLPLWSPSASLQEEGETRSQRPSGEWPEAGEGERGGEEPAQDCSQQAQPVPSPLASSQPGRSQVSLPPPICFPILSPLLPGPLVSCNAWGDVLFHPPAQLDFPPQNPESGYHSPGAALPLQTRSPA